MLKGDNLFLHNRKGNNFVYFLLPETRKNKLGFKLNYSFPSTEYSKRLWYIYLLCFFKDIKSSFGF